VINLCHFIIVFTCATVENSSLILAEINIGF